MQDYCGVITRTPEDQAQVSSTRWPSATPGSSPRDSRERGGKADARPTRRSYLNQDALKGKTIGYYTLEFTSPWGDEGTMNAMKEEFKFFERAGATVKLIKPAPEFSRAGFAITGDTGFEGCSESIEDHRDSPYKSPPEITLSQLRIPQLRSASTTYTGAGAMSEASIDEFVNYTGKPIRRNWPNGWRKKVSTRWCSRASNRRSI